MAECGHVDAPESKDEHYESDSKYHDDIIDDLQRRVHDVSKATKQRLELRSERKHIQRNSQHVKENSSTETLRADIDRIQSWSQHQDEDIGVLFELVQNCIKLQSTQLQLLRETIRSDKDEIYIKKSLEQKVEPDPSQAEDINLQKKEYELNLKSDDIGTSIKESTFPKTETTTLIPELSKTTHLNFNNFGKQSPNRFKNEENSSNKGQSMPVSLPKRPLPESNLGNDRRLYLKYLRREITRESEDNRWEVYIDDKETSQNDNSSVKKNVHSQLPHRSGISTHLRPTAGGNKQLTLSLTDRPASQEQSAAKTSDPPEPVFVSKKIWLECARDHLAKLIQERVEHPLKGQCTILCLDVSASMQGKPMQDMKEFVSKYLDHAEYTSSQHKLHDYIGMVTFGHETRVLHGATTNYKVLRASLDKLYADGPSPLYAGLIMAEAAIHKGKWSVFDVPFHPRVVLVTDGYITPAEMICGPDDSVFLDMNSVPDVIDRARMLGCLQAKIFAVPVGKSKIEFLRQVTRMTYGGVLLNTEAHTQLYRSFRNFVIGLKIRLRYRTLYRWNLHLEAIAEDPTFTYSDMCTIFWRDKISSASVCITHMCDTEYFIAPLYQTLYQEDMERFLNELFERLAEEADDKYVNTTVPGLPPVGTRVRRGPEWTDGIADGNGPGTVIGIRPEGLVRVIWDTYETGFYKYGGEDVVFQVVVVDDIREHDSHIRPGMLMKRGPHWEGGDEDGGPGSIGVVYRSEAYQIVSVRWPTGVAKPYEFLFMGRMEIEACNADDIKRYKEMRKAESVSGPSVAEVHKAKKEQQTFTMEEILPPQYAPGVSATPEAATTSETMSGRPTTLPKAPQKREVPHQMQREAASAGLQRRDPDPSLDMIIPYELSTSTARHPLQRPTRQLCATSPDRTSVQKPSRPNKNRTDPYFALIPKTSPSEAVPELQNRNLTTEEELAKIEELNARNRARKDDIA